MSETLMINKCDKKKKHSKFSSAFKKMTEKGTHFFSGHSKMPEFPIRQVYIYCYIWKLI